MRMLKALLVVAIAVSPFLLVWQWGDFTDSGYTSTMAQNFAADAAEGHLRSEFLLTLAAGGLFLETFPAGGLLGLYVVAAAMVAVASFSPLFALRGSGFSNDPATLFAVLGAQAFVIRGWLQFDYDTVSMLFLAWAAAFAVQGAVGGKAFLMLAAGFLVSAAGFARLPGLLGLSLCALPFLLPVSRGDQTHGGAASRPAPRFTEQCRLVLVMLAGFAVGVSLGLAVVWASGLSGAYANGLADLFTRSQTSGSHGVSRLAATYGRELVHLLWPWFPVGLAWLTSLAALSRSSVPRWAKWVFAGGTFCLLFLHIAANPTAFRHPLKYMVPALVLPATAALLFAWRRIGPAVTGTLLAGLCIGAITMAGSNTGILKFAPSLLYLLPGCVAGAIALARCGTSHGWSPWKSVAVGTTAVILLASMATRAFSLYGASFYHDRLHYTHRVDVPVLQGLRTSHERAEAMEQACQILRSTDPAAPLFVYGHTPILYLASQKRPYTSMIWLADDMHRPDAVVEGLRAKYADSGVLPIIAVTERDVLGVEGWQAMDRFLQENGYVRAHNAEFPRIMNLEVYAVGSEQRKAKSGL